MCSDRIDADELKARAPLVLGRRGWQTRLATGLGVYPQTVRRWISARDAIPAYVTAIMECLEALKRAGLPVPQRFGIASKEKAPMSREEIVLKAAGYERETHAASGRYARSAPIRSQFRFVAFTHRRNRMDRIAIQGYGVNSGCPESMRRNAQRLVAHGLKEHSDNNNQVTYVADVPYLPDGGVDQRTIRAKAAEMESLIYELLA